MRGWSEVPILFQLLVPLIGFPLGYAIAFIPSRRPRRALLWALLSAPLWFGTGLVLLWGDLSDPNLGMAFTALGVFFLLPSILWVLVTCFGYQTGRWRVEEGS